MRNYPKLGLGLVAVYRDFRYNEQAICVWDLGDYCALDLQVQGHPRVWGDEDC